MTRLLLILGLLAGGAQAQSDSAQADSAVVRDTLELAPKRVKARGTPAHREKQVSRIHLQRDDLLKVAAAQGDPLKVISTLPGVANQNDLSVRPFVRGGKAEETQVYWDDIPLLQPYHFASVYSIFNMEDIKDLAFYSGGFPAHAGNALSGVLLMRPRPAPLDSFRLYTDLSLLRGNSHIGVPILKDKLGVSFSYQAFWYDWVVDRVWDAIDIARNDSAFSADKQEFRRYVDLPNFRDLQFGAAWKASGRLGADYTGIVSNDGFTARNTEARYFVDGREVSPDYYFSNESRLPAERMARRTSWDSLAVISVDNQVHALRFQWRPKEDWEIDQTVAFQSQDWQVRFMDDEVWVDSTAPDGSFAGHSRPSPSDMLFQLGNQAWDWRFVARRHGEKHRLEAGLSQSIRSSRYDTRLPRPIYETIVNGNVDAMDFLGQLNPEGFTLMGSDPAANSRVDYLAQLPQLIRFDHKGRRAVSFMAAHVSDEWNLDDRHRLTVGLRAETDDAAGNFFLSPRAAFFQSLGDKDELSWATGLYSQGDLPFYMRAVNPDLKPEKAFHFNVEWTHYFTPRYRFEVQLYQKRYYDLVSPVLINTGKLNFGDGILGGLDSSALDSLAPEQRRFIIDNFSERRLEYENRGRGEAGGFELAFFYDPADIWSGWLSAELGYSERIDGPGKRTYDFRLHRPWAYNWVNYFRMPSQYELSLRARFAAGLPYTDYRSVNLGDPGPGGGFGDIDSYNPDTDTLFHVGPRNGRRYSPYARWDVRLTKNFKAFGHPMQSYFEIWNAFNTPNFLMSDSRTKDWRFVDLNYPVPIIFLGLNYRW